MMYVIPKWRVTITRVSAPSLVLFISDQFLSNVLRKLADIELEQQPSDLRITLVDELKAGNMSTRTPTREEYEAAVQPKRADDKVTLG